MIKIQLCAASDEMTIKFDNVSADEYNDYKYFYANISKFNNIINFIKTYDLNHEIENIVEIKNNKFISLDFIENTIFKELFNDDLFQLDFRSVCAIILNNANVDHDSFNELIQRFVAYGYDIEAFDESDLAQIMLKFYVVEQVYKKSIINRKNYVDVFEFYNCTNDDIVDYCI